MDPIIDGKATWVALSPTTAEGCMALPFFFARNLYKDLQVPIGLVQIAVAGTTQTAWASKETLDAQKTDGPRTYTYDDCFTVAEAGLAKGKGPFKSWREFADADTAWHANPTGRWPATLEIMDYPSVLYNALVHPLAPMAMRGMLWHQGEAGPAIGYGARMVAMVDQWRKLYEQDFYFIQGSMTRFTHVSPPLAPAFEGLRSDIDEQFLLSQTLFGPDGKSALCGFVDLGNTGTHWERKDEAGRRMAQAAMTIAYGKPAAYTGPQLIESTITGATIRCRFSNVGTGLKYEPSIDGISGFILHGGSGGQQTSVWVTPQIEGTDTLVFSDPSIPAPDNIYYAWAQNPHDTLFNSDGLPAYPFRLKAANDRSEPSPISMVTIVSQVDPKAVLHLSDVHRYAYVFSFLDNKKGAGSNTVKVYLPKEWAKPGASQDGKDFPLGDITPDAQGNRFAQVQIDTNASPLVIYDASKPDALVGANTQRN
jgi:sialate O-acetylesterase